MTDNSDVPDGEILSASEVDEAVENGEEAANAVSINDVTEEEERRNELSRKVASGDATESEWCEHELLILSFSLEEIPDEPTLDDVAELTGEPRETFEGAFNKMREKSAE
jgi:hypothetical protein